MLIKIIEKGLKGGSQEKKGAGGSDPLCPSIAHSFRKKKTVSGALNLVKIPVLSELKLRKTAIV